MQMEVTWGFCLFLYQKCVLLDTDTLIVVEQTNAHLNNPVSLSASFTLSNWEDMYRFLQIPNILTKFFQIHITSL